MIDDTQRAMEIERAINAVGKLDQKSAQYRLGKAQGLLFGLKRGPWDDAKLLSKPPEGLLCSALSAHGAAMPAGAVPDGGPGQRTRPGSGPHLAGLG